MPTPPPPNSPVSVTLNVMVFDATTPATWVVVNLPNGAKYAYLYTGGDDSRGDADFTINAGTGTVNLSLATEALSRFEVDDVKFNPEGAAGFSYQGANSGRGAVIIDQAKRDSAPRVKYTVDVLDTRTGNIVPCDPQITNKA